MLLDYKIKNYKTFNDEVEISLKADMHIKKFMSNTITVDKINALKTIGIYGPNNTGKTCLIESISLLSRLMLGEPCDKIFNSFYDDYITNIEATYEINGNIYKYSLEYNSNDKKYLSERLDKLSFSESNNLVSEKIFLRNRENIEMKSFGNKKFPINLINDNYPLFMVFDLRSTLIENVQKDYLEFARSIRFVNMELPISISKTIELMQNDEKARRFIVSFAKNCDLNIEDFGYSNDVLSDVNINDKISIMSQQNVNNKELLKIWSKHHGHIVPSIFFDSIGTRKLLALAGYIYEALTNGGALLIDELDSSLHHVIIRAIIALFNNELNNKAQLIFSTHDALTMDLKRLFRKDQIYLTDIDKSGNNVLIHLSKEFTSRSENGFRGNEDIVDYYLKGRFGGIPTPDLFDTMYEVYENE